MLTQEQTYNPKASQEWCDFAHCREAMDPAPFPVVALGCELLEFHSCTNWNATLVWQRKRKLMGLTPLNIKALKFMS